MITVFGIMDSTEDRWLFVIVPQYIVVTSYSAYARIERNRDIWPSFWILRMHLPDPLHLELELGSDLVSILMMVINYQGPFSELHPGLVAFLWLVATRHGTV